MASKLKKQQRKEVGAPVLRVQRSLGFTWLDNCKTMQACRQLQELKQLVTTAEKDKDVLRHFLPFKQYARNGITASVSFWAAAAMPAHLQEWAYQLCKRNMHDLYLPVWGWNERKKRRELQEEAARYLIASGTEPTPQSLAYLHFRFELEEEQPILYCYELQLEEAAQRKGLGKFLMQLLELIGIKYSMRGVMLTVMRANQAALSFYTKLGYKEHETSPGYDDPTEEAGYQIMFKPLPQAKVPKGNSCLQDNTNTLPPS